jgi:hypothetical protein
MAFQREGTTNSSNPVTTASMSSRETARSGHSVRTAKGSGERPRVFVQVNILGSRFHAAWRNPLPDLKLVNKPPYTEWEFEGLQSGGREVGQPKAQKVLNQVKKKTTIANIVEFERTIPSGVRGSFWW